MYIINVHESCIRRTTYLHACSIVNNTRYLYGYKYYIYMCVYRIEHRKIKCCSHISPDLTLDVTIDINYDRHRAARTSRTTVTESAFPIFLVRNVKRDIRNS